VIIGGWYSTVSFSVKPSAFDSLGNFSARGFGRLPRSEGIPEGYYKFVEQVDRQELRERPDGTLHDSSQVAQVSPSIHAYHFIIDETIEAKRLIKKLYQVVNLFMAGSFRCNLPMANIISKSMKRYLVV
jgi:hypothetical protein